MKSALMLTMVFQNSGPYLQQRDAAASQRHEILVQTYFETVSFAGFISGDEGLCSKAPSSTDKRMRSLWPREHTAMTPGGRLAVAVCCGQQILEALKYVHAAGLIHGDVSMANILIGGLKQDDLAALSVVSKNARFTNSLHPLTSFIIMIIIKAG
jgi:serine/threonine protein kinase